MASAWYPEGKRALMNKEEDLDTDVVKVRAVADAGYTYSSAHTDITSVTAYVGSTDPTITCDITTTPGTLDATDLTPGWSSLAQDSTNNIDALVVYNSTTGTPLVYIDLTTPLTPNGGDINVTWNASGVAAL